MLAALAFVPETDVIIAFEAVSEDFPLDGQAVIDHFETPTLVGFMPTQTFFFKSHQPTSGCTGNHCTIRKLCT